MWTCCAYPAPSVAPAADPRPPACRPRRPLAPGPPRVRPQQKDQRHAIPNPPRPGPVGPRPPRAAERGRALQERRRRPERPRRGSSTGTPTSGSTRSTRPTCAAGSAGGACTPSAGPASAAARPAPSRTPRSRTPYFMMRVRIPGGQLDRRAAAHGRRDRQGVRPRPGRHHRPAEHPVPLAVRIEDVPAIWERLEAVGLSSQQACGDVPRNILGCPVAGIDAERDPRRQPRCCARPRRWRPPTPGSRTCRASTRPPSSGCASHVHRARDQRHLVRRRHRPGRHARVRPVGRRRPVHQPDAGPAARRVRPTRTGCRRCGRA